VGLLLATTSWRLGPAASRLALAGGAALVLAAAVLLDGSAPFAAAPMVLPVAGAALVLLAGAADAGAGGPLAHRWLVWVGDRSYSWYLWHWPAIALARTALVDSTAVTVAAGILSLAPAMASYRFVEHRYWRRLRL